MRKLLARSLAALLCLQGYPILALQETGVRARPVVPGWVDDLADWAEEIDLAARARPRFTQVGELLREAWESIELPWSCATALSSRHASAGDEGLQPPPGPSSSPRKELDPQRLQELRRAVADSDRERAGRTPLADAPLPFRQVERKARTAKTAAMDERAVSSAAPQPRRVIPKDAPAPEIVALAHSFGDSPGRIFRFVHDEIDYDPKWGAGKSPLGTLHERRGTSWEQAWLLQQLLTAAGVDARLEWGEVEITTAKLLNLTGVADAFRAGDLLTTAGVPIVLIVDGSQVVGARMSHVWVRAFLDYIPRRGATAGPGDTWIRMDPSLKRFDVGAVERLDEEVPFGLGEYLQSGTLFSPRAFYEDALQAYADAHNLGVAGIEELKPAKSLIQEAFPFVPASTRAKILTVSSEATEVPAAYQQQLELQVREAGGPVLLTWSTPWTAVYGKRLEVAWPGATSADQAALDLSGGVFATAPYEVDLRPVVRVDGVELASGEAIGSAEDVELLATLTPPGGSPTVALFEMFAGEHAVLTVDFGQIAQETVDRYTAERDAATDPGEEEAWALALAGAAYLRSLSADLEHLSALRYRRLVKLGNVVLAVHRGAVSRSPDGTPLTFSAAPPSLDLGAMVLGLFPADGVAGPASTSVSTLELLGAQGSAREGEALAQALGGGHLTAVGFLTRASREGQTLTRVDATNVEPALAAAELGSDAEASVRAGVGRGLIGWISEAQLPFETWDATGYVLEDPSTGAGGYFVTYERLVQGLEANVIFHSPQDLDVVTAPVDVVATLEGEEIESWTLAYRSPDGRSTVELASGTGTFSNATLARFDPTLLLNGSQNLVLTARDAAGQSASRKISVVVEGNMKVGNFTLSYVDLAVPVSGLDVEVVRTYDSRDRRAGDFGVGWTLDVRQGSYANNRPPGEGWQITEGFLPCERVTETRSHLTTIRLSESEVYRFKLSLTDSAPILGGCFARARFDFLGGPLPGATLAIRGNDEVLHENGSDRLIDVDSLELFEPQQVRFTTRDGRVFDLDLDAGVTALEDLSGNRLEITPAGIHHSSGRGIAFERDPEGRIRRVSDPLGEDLVYAYDAGGDLASVTDRDGHTTRYTYDSHLLVGIEDPLGRQAARNEYDAEGRLVRHVDAAGKVTELEHDVDGRREVVTDREGRSRILEYDERGNVVRETDEEGHLTTRTFDARGNLLSETDALGNTTARTYDAANLPATVTDPEGHTTTYGYDAHARVTSVTDPRGNRWTAAYDAAGNRTATTDPLGNVTTFEHDGSGNLIEVTDAEGGVTRYEYDAAGNEVREIDPLGNAIERGFDEAGRQVSQTLTRTLPDGAQESLVFTFGYDNTGRLTERVDPDGATRRQVYDANGNLVAEVDPLGRTTAFTYDARNLLAATTFADGTVESRTYDGEERLLTVTDPAGRTTSFAYDGTGRLLATTYPDGSATTHQYDAAGREIATTDERGNTTRFEHDGRGLRTAVRDALGQVARLAYDANGNQVSATDPAGHATAYEHDASNRLVRIVHPDGTETRLAHDKLGRQISETDPAGLVTRFAYDADGRLIRVTDPLDQVTSFAYDEVDNLTSQTDVLGRVTRFEHDALSRPVRRTLPDGAVESMSYDAAGRKVSHTRPGGDTITFAYDARDRLVAKGLPGGAHALFTYTAAGNLASMADAHGTTTFEHDVRDRLVRRTSPAGWELGYGYDAHGNRTEVRATVGAASLATTFAYDALDRLSRVTDPQGGQYEHAYDPNGNLASLAYPNGVVTAYAYDSRNRLLDLGTRDADGNVLLGLAYTLGAAGNRTRIAEHDGTVSDYAYDALYRLTGERVSAGAAFLYEDAFAYDAAGNRLSRTHDDGGGAPVTLTSTYDVRDRLLTAGAESFTWDIDGNLRSRTGPKAASLTWDFENRLTGVDLAGGVQVENAYDAGGERVSARVAPPSEPASAVTFLVDASRELSRSVAEVDESGNLLAYYVWGDQLLGVVRPAGTRYFHQDGLGSVRLLTDETGQVTDRYRFAAFGELAEHDGSDPNAYLFAGEIADLNSGFYFLRARWLDPAAGRFASADPFPGLLFEPQSLHKYVYVDNDPVNRTDPSGLFGSGGTSLVSVAVVGAIVGAIAANVIFRPSGWFDTVTVTVGGAVVGAAIALIMAEVALGSVTAAATGTAAGAGAVAVPLLVNAQRLTMPYMENGRIWLGHFGGTAIRHGNQIIPTKGAGLFWLESMALRFGGRFLTGFGPGGIALKDWLALEIEAARHIVFNISLMPFNSLAFWEFRYILFRPHLWHKVTLVYNATMK